LIVSEKDIRKFTDRVGREMKGLQDEIVEEFNQKGHVTRSDPHTPPAAVVMVDAGRAQVREEDAGRGVHAPRWCGPRYATLRSLSCTTHQCDPHPDVPKAFLDDKHVKALADDIVLLKKRTPQDVSPEQDDASSASHAHQRSEKKSESPTLLVQTCVAAVASSEQFGPMVAAEASRRGFYNAPCKAFVADGELANWTIQQDFFFDFIPILDFIHCLGHLFAAADAAKNNNRDAWRLYRDLITAAWRGNPKKVVRLLQKQADIIGLPPKKAKPTDPRKILADSITYINNNADRMDYPTYRKLGLPFSSCNIESLIKQFNLRVKASDKFWIAPCLDNVLQVRAGWLSDDSRWDDFWKTRAACVAAKIRRYRAPAA